MFCGRRQCGKLYKRFTDANPFFGTFGYSNEYRKCYDLFTYLVRSEVRRLTFYEYECFLAAMCDVSRIVYSSSQRNDFCGLQIMLHSYYSVTIIAVWYLFLCCVSSHSLTKTPITKSLCAYLRFTPLNFSIADPALVPVLLNVITISFGFQPLNKSACSELLGQFYNLYSSSYALVQSGPSSIRSNAYSLSTMPRPFDTRAGNRVRPVTKCNAVSLCRFIK